MRGQRWGGMRRGGYGWRPGFYGGWGRMGGWRRMGGWGWGRRGCGCMPCCSFVLVLPLIAVAALAVTWAVHWI